MEPIWLITILTNIVVGCMGWILKTMHSETRELRKVLQNTREDYVRKEDLKQLKDELSLRFDRLESIILNKIIKD